MRSGQLFTEDGERREFQGEGDLEKLVKRTRRGNWAAKWFQRSAAYWLVWWDSETGAGGVVCCQATVVEPTSRGEKVQRNIHYTYWNLGDALTQGFFEKELCQLMHPNIGDFAWDKLFAN